MSTGDALHHEDHPLIGSRVHDIASRQEGELTAIVCEPVTDRNGNRRYVRLAFIKAASGIEWSTSAESVEAVR